jgi:parallel beta-helix repeat protein
MKKKFLESPLHHKIFFVTVALAVLSACSFTGIFYAKKAFTSPAPSAPADFRMPFDSFRMKGETSGIGTQFAITDSEYLNITLDSTETVDLRLTSMPKVITMMFNPATTTSATTTEITISGLVKNTTYYKYEDDYHHLAQFTSDDNGAYSYAQDISIQHFVFIQTRKSTKFIADNETGGDCTTIGNWNAETKTCTLTTDISETVQIDSDGITLDGNNHNLTITPANTTVGVFIPNRVGVVIKNLVIHSASDGIILSRSSGSTITNNIIAESGMGIFLDFSVNNEIIHNTTDNGTFGIRIQEDSSGNVVSSNTLQENDYYDLYVGGYVFSPSAYCNNIITGNIGSGNRPIGFFNSSVILNNVEYAELILCNADGSNINNVTIMGSAQKKNNGLLMWLTDNSTLSDITATNGFGMDILTSNSNIFKNVFVSNSDIGIALIESHNNEIDGGTLNNNNTGILSMMDNAGIVIHNVTISNNATGVSFFGAGHLVYNNNFIGNGIQTIAEGPFNLQKPIGGNYWSDYHTPAQGCNDQDTDGFCDAPYVVGNTQDNLPWTKQDGWKGTTTPQTLTLATTTEDDFIQDEKGVADKTKFTFSVVYTDPSGGTASPQVRLYLDSKYGTSSLSIRPDTSTTTPPELHDGDFANGELFARTLTFPKGVYTYHYEANGGAQRFPATGELTFTTGYSNVAFLPGIKASRLFRYDCGNPDCEDQLWEPNADSDTVGIVLNPDGSSADTGIYLKNENAGILDQANITTEWNGAIIDLFRDNFYISFIESMNKLVTPDENGKEIINKWKALPYDWRLAFPKILNNGYLSPNGYIYYDDSYGTETRYLLNQIRSLARTSATGKVTIIGHSMGGLLAKKILRDYSDIATSTETLILVDSPQLGTPQAIASLLHGTKEDIPEDFGFVSSQEVGREVVQNMPSAYTLLPSKKYVERVMDENQNYTTLMAQNENLRNIADDPLYDSSKVLNFYQTKYGTTTITTYDGLKDFLGGNDGHLQAPDNDVIHPKIIQADMMRDAQLIHDDIDNWIPPKNIRIVQIAGWGIPSTIRGLEYKGNFHQHCNNAGMNTFCWDEGKFDVELLFTFDGDGRVVLPSQIGMATTTEMYFVDLYRYNTDNYFSFLDPVDRTHASVLEVDTVRDLLQNIIEEKENPANSLRYIKTEISQLNPTGINKLIRLSLRSPVRIDIFNQQGSHLGISASSTPNYTLYDTEMPNSYYLEMGEGKYLGFSLEASTTIKLQGTGTGTFTLSLEQYQGDTKEASQTFTDIPVSTTTKATLIINTLNDAKELALDNDGNGTIDTIVFTDENKETITFQTLKNEILKLDSKVRPALLNQATVAEKQFAKKNYIATKALLLVLKKEIQVLSQKKIANKWQIEKMQALRITAVIDELISQMDEFIYPAKKNSKGRKY